MGDPRRPRRDQSLTKAPARSRGGSGREGVSVAFGTLVACLVLVLLCWSMRSFSIDDTYIFLRYARNLAEGHGMRYNPADPPVEGYSNTLWTLALAGAARLGVDPLTGSKLLGVAAATACVALTPLLIPLANRRTRVLAAVLVALSPPLIIWSVSGMGTPFAALFVCLWVLAVQRTEFTARGCVALGALSAAGVLVRPEAILLLGALWAIMVWRRGEGWLRRVGLSALGAALVLVPLVVFRMAYFGHPLPSPFYAKVAGEAQPSSPMVTGTFYVLQFVLQYGGGALMLFGLIRAFTTARERPQLWLPPAAAIIAWFIYVPAVGADWMPQFRFLAPIVPVFFALTAVGVQWLYQALPDRSATARAVVVAAIVVLVGSQAVGMGIAQGAWHRVESRAMSLGWYNWAIFQLREQALYVRDHSGPDCTVAARDIGQLGYYTDCHVIDTWGLTDYRIAVMSPEQKTEHILQMAPDYWQHPFETTLEDPGFQAQYEPVEGDPWKLWKRVETVGER